MINRKPHPANSHTLALRMLEEQRLKAEIQKGLDSGTITGQQHHERFAKKCETVLKSRDIN